MESLARPEGAGKSASPTDLRARKGRPKKTGRNFVQPTHDQVAYPLSRRGTPPDDDHLSSLEKLLLIAMETQAWKFGGLCKMTNLELAKAIGLEGPNRVRYVKYLLNGRTRAGKKYSGILARGFVKSVPDGDPRNPAHRILVRLPKWVEYQKDHPEIRVWTEGSHASGDSDHGATERVGPGPREGGPGPMEGVGPRPPLSFEQFERSPEDSKTFNVVGSPEPETRERHPRAIPPAGAPASGTSPQVAPPAADGAERAELVRLRAEVARLRAELAQGDAGGPGSGPAIAEDDPPPVVVAGDAAGPQERGEAPSDDDLEAILGRPYLGADRTVQATRFLAVLLSRTDGQVNALPDGRVVLGKRFDQATLDEEWVRMFAYFGPEIAAIKAQDRADAAAKANAAPRTPARARPAPLVRDPAKIRGLIGRVVGAPDDTLSRELAARLVGPEAFNDRDRQVSEGAYYSLCEHLRHRELTDEDFQDAFEAACEAKVQKRGALFVKLALAKVPVGSVVRKIGG